MILAHFLPFLFLVVPKACIWMTANNMIWACLTERRRNVLIKKMSWREYWAQRGFVELQKGAKHILGACSEKSQINYVAHGSIHKSFVLQLNFLLPNKQHQYKRQRNILCLLSPQMFKCSDIRSYLFLLCIFLLG